MLRGWCYPQRGWRCLIVLTQKNIKSSFKRLFLMDTSFILRPFVYGIHHLQSIFHISETTDLHWSEMPFVIFLNMVLAMWISTRLLCQFVVLNLSVSRYVLESVLGYNFGHDKQLAFCWLFIIVSTPYWRVPKRTKQLSTVEVAGLVRVLAHIGSLTN